MGPPPDNNGQSPFPSSPPPAYGAPPPPNYMAPPPGYVPYGGYGAYGLGPTQRIGGLTKWLIGLMIASLAAQAISLVLQLALRSAAQDYVNNTLTSSQFTNKAATYVLVAVLLVFVGLAQLVLLIIWTFRMAKNMRSLGRVPQTFSPGWTIAINILGGCTLGIANFFMWSEIWKGSDPDTAVGDPTWKQRSVGAVVMAYLVLTLASVAAGFGLGVGNAVFSFRSGSNNTVATNLSDKFGLVVVVGIIQLATLVVFLQLVRQLSARHMRATKEVA